VRGCLLAIRHWWANDSDESGVTQVELLIAVVLAAVLIGAVFAYVQVGMSANARVSAQAHYSQGLALAANQIIDGSGNTFLGMRSASSVQPRSGGGFEFRYSGTSHTESYWISRGELFRSADGGGAEKVVRADGLSIENAGEGCYTVRLSANAVGPGPLQSIWQVWKALACATDFPAILSPVGSPAGWPSPCFAPLW
jgi:type II secretory pathway pseudopilin PulG